MADEIISTDVLIIGAGIAGIRAAIEAHKKDSNLSWVEALEAKNMVTIAEMVLKNALMREESRGLHERANFLEEDPNWIKHIIIEKVGQEMKFTTEEVLS